MRKRSTVQITGLLLCAIVVGGLLFTGCKKNENASSQTAAKPEATKPAPPAPAPRIRVDNVEPGRYKGNYLEELLAHSIGSAILLIDLEKLRCPEQEFRAAVEETIKKSGHPENLERLAIQSCAKGKSFVSVGNQFKQRGYLAEQVEIEAASAPMQSSGPAPDSIIRIEKAVKQIHAQNELSGVQISFHIEITYSVTNTKTNRQQKFNSSTRFSVHDGKDQKEVATERARVAAVLFDQEKGIVGQIAEWLKQN